MSVSDVETIGIILVTVGSILGFFEWRYQTLIRCIHRIEDRLDRLFDRSGGEKK